MTLHDGGDTYTTTSKSWAINKDGRLTWEYWNTPQVSPDRVAPKAQSWPIRLLVAGLSACFVLTLVALTAGVTGLAVKWAWSVLVR